MNALGHGVTPKMRPIPTRRSVGVAALDVGSLHGRAILID